MKTLKIVLLLFLLVGCMASEGFFNRLFEEYGLPVVNYNHVVEMKEKESSMFGDGTSYLIIDDHDFRKQVVELLMNSTNLVGYYQGTTFLGSEDRDYVHLIQHEQPLIDFMDELEIFDLIEITNDEEVMLMLFNDESSRFGLIWLHGANKLTE